MPEDRQARHGRRTAGGAAAARDGRHARVVPAVGLALVDDPLQLALREQRAHEIDAREAPQVHVAQLEVLEEPLVLRVAVRVLPVAQRVRAKQKASWVQVGVCV